MKIITINSSPRKANVSRTSLMLRHLVTGMRDAGAEVESFNVHDYEIEYCTACFACFNKRFNETELCIFKDAMTQELLPKWRKADLVVYASPVFFHSITAKLKTFFERTLPAYVSFSGEDAGGSYNPAPGAAHPALAFLSVSGSPEDTAFDDFRNYIRCFEPIAEIYRTGSTLMSLPFCKDRVADILSATEEAGRELVRERRISDATMARITQPLHDDGAFIAKIATAHQTLLPGHRALMTFPVEAKRELRALPPQAPLSPPAPASQGAALAVAAAPAPVAVATAGGTPGLRRRRVNVAPSSMAQIDAKLTKLLHGGAPEPVPAARESAAPAPGLVLAPAAAPAPAAPPAGSIAIVGMSGRFAAAPDLDALWHVLESGSDLVSNVTRWDLAARYADAPRYGRHGGLLPDIAGFDALFFRIAGNEALHMDPQQRIFLEESWLALEDAGYASAAISSLRCGVYAGCSDGDYRDLFPAKTPPQAFWGNAPSVIPSRIAYALDLKGPAVAVDTACSSALVAVHMACQALRAGEVDIALSGGVFVQCTPRLFDAANNAGMLSPTGHCHAFDRRADGFVIGEGAGALVLKRLDDALAAGDHIHGVIRASGVNQDGTTNGLTAPSALSQEQLIRQVHRDAGIGPGGVQLVEAHGTGTKLGDPIEFRALARAFAGGEPGQGAAAPGAVMLGSIKTNIGHAGAAAGAAGLFKVLLAMRHGLVPPSLHFEAANPLLALQDSPFDVPRQARPWPQTDGPRRAAVSSFGFSGTNAHVVVEHVPPHAVASPQATGHLFVVSGRTPLQLARTAERLAAHFARIDPPADLGHASFTLLTGRTHQRCRFACVVENQAQLLAALRGIAAEAGEAPGHSAPAAESRGGPRQSAAAQRIATAAEARGADRLHLLNLIAEDYRTGLELDFSPLFAGGGYRRMPLPGTALIRNHYWVDAPVDQAGPIAPEASPAPEATSEEAGLLAGEVFLAPVFTPVEPAPDDGAAVDAVLFVAPGADVELTSALVRAPGIYETVRLDAGADDAALRAQIDAAVAGRTHIVWVAPAPESGTSLPRQIAAAQECGVLLLFRAARALLDLGHGARRLDWTILTQQTRPVHDETGHPDHAAIHGFAGSLAKEVERWRLRVADLPLAAAPGDDLFAELRRLQPGPEGVSFYGRAAGGPARLWYRHRLLPALPATGTYDPAPCREGGVFVVLGGAGGIGRAWTEHAVRRARARVVWVGRRPLDASIDAALDAVAAIGPRPVYISADATDPDAMARVRVEVAATLGPVNGIVHSAIVLRDAATATLDTRRFREALEPKVGLTLDAIDAFAGEPLDFILFFSSMIAFTPAAGQGNYAAGSAFKDALAARLTQDMPCPVRVINWGYWGDTGIVAQPEYRARMARHGMASISAPAAMRALDVLFAQPGGQLAFMATSRAVDIPVIDATGVVALAPSGVRLTDGAPASPLEPVEVGALQPQLQVLHEIEAAAAPLVAAQIVRVRAPKLRHAEPWVAAAKAFPAVAGDGGADHEDAWRRWEDLRLSWRSDADRHARAELADAAIRALPDVLEGRIPATHVLFPEGSSRLVEGLYRRNQVADAFNRWSADAVLGEARRLALAPSGIRLLEVGAGTGGTTAAVLDMLDAHGLSGALTEYAYTDVSGAFLAAARAEFGARCPAASFRTLDIARPPAAQGFAEAAYDIVLAANVLHATADIAVALRHAKALLRPGGLLVLNELSIHTLLTHVTFGLLDSWWQATDTMRRLPGGPALSPGGWTAALRDEGFAAIRFPASAAHRFGQQIVVARSDGAIRHDAGQRLQRAAAPAAAVAVALPEVTAPDVAPAAPGLREIERVILDQLSLTLGVERAAIDAGEAFADYGLDSLTAVQLVQALNKVLGVVLKPGDLYSHASASRLAQHIASLAPTPPPPVPQAAEAPSPAAVVHEQPAGPPPIAIIGMSVRAGGAETADALWQALSGAKTLVGETARWPGARHPGAFLDDIAGFDAGFFNITGLEARYMDPQQRAFLMESYRALEDAGYAGESLAALRARPVGVFAGCYPGDYFQLFGEDAPAQAMWGAAGSVIPARLSYFLDFQGPAVSVDTACSSSLVAIHLACQSLIAGECGVAVAGGVALQSTPRFFSFASRAGMLSASGRCHAFDSRADGFVAGEGVACLVLKPLAQALADGDHVHGVIRASAMNQDGASNGITAPNGAAQARLLKQAFATTGIDPASLGMIEAHGTGTRLGDPIEFDALREVFASAKPGSCALGSIKATLGHTLAAAGVFGVVRVLLALRHGAIPPMPDFQTPNPALDLVASPFAINSEALPWPAAGAAAPRRAGVSSFGFSGTNAHVILEEAPPPPQAAVEDGRPLLFLLSAETATQLRAMAQALAAHCRAHRPRLTSVSFTLLAGRRRLAQRLAFVASSHDELQQRIQSWLDGRSDSHDAAGAGLVERARRLMQGEDVPWQDLFAPGESRRIPLPVYPFQLERYWPPMPETAHLPAMAEARPQQLRYETWTPKPLAAAEAAGLPARTAILASAETAGLARRIASRIPGSFIAAEGDAFPPGGLDAVIDCTGCAATPVSSLGWLGWPQALARQGSGRYLCLTRGLAATGPGDDTVAPDGRVLHGALARMLQQEYRRLSSGHVDYALADSDEAIAATAAAELAACGSDPWAAWRRGQRYVRVLSGGEPSGAPRSAIAFPAERAVWITGGTRGLGLLCARHLVAKHGVRRLVLTGRNPVPPRSAWQDLARAGGEEGQRFAAYLALEAAGVELHVAALDLADTASIGPAVRAAEVVVGPVGGLIHCAGLADGETTAFLRKTAAGVARVLAPKTEGLEQLWSALAGDGGVQAVLFSSLTAAEPALAVGQSDYAMANAYLDAFARHHDGRNGARQRVLSLQWPNWAATGMGEVKSSALRRSGYAALSDAEGLALLDRALSAPPAAVVLPAVILPPGAPAPVAAERDPEPAALALPATGAAEAWLTALVARELEMPTERVKPEVPFPDYGVDSILLTGIHGALARALGTALDPTLLYTCSSIRALASWLAQNHAAALQAVVAPETVAPAAPPALSPIPAPAPTPPALMAAPRRAGVAARGIAVVGMACCFPGAPDLPAYWRLLRDGRSAIAPIPASRSELGTGGYAALLSGDGPFDHAFFGIPAAEAAAMPRQARLVLETALACFRHAGYRLDEVKGRDIGVYLGARGSAPPPDEVLAGLRHPVRVVGQNYLAASVAQFFDLRGPASVVDTACSSALVAMNSAIQAMRCGELEAALVGGVNVLDGDGPLRMFRKRGLANESGAFHVFDRRAAGVVLGEGCGMALLKPLDRALADGDVIHAVVEAVAVNNDGRTAGPTAPNVAAQAAVMAAALTRAGRNAGEISYLEVNGSGSEVTDLLELKAIAAAYGAPRSQPLQLGSVKPNIGHPLCAEGIAGFIKVAAMLSHGVTVPCLSGAEPMVHADFAAANAAMAEVGGSFPEDSPVAAINVFADGGTNAHAILSAWRDERDSAQLRQPLPPAATHRTPMPVPGEPAPNLSAGADFDLPRRNFWAQ